MKRRSLTVLLCLLAIISLASVGFASWVISAGDDVEATGNIQVENVSDERLVISAIQFNGVAYGEESMPKFIFGKAVSEDEGYAAANKGWLNATNVDDRVMTIKLTFDVDFKDGHEVIISGDKQNANVSVSWDADKTKWLNEAVTKGYIAAIPTLTVAQTVSGSYEVSIAFEWGSLFDGKNPFIFYNTNNIDAELIVDANGKVVEGASVKTTYGDHASKYLAEMFKFFNDNDATNSKFALKISAQPFTPQQVNKVNNNYQ